MASKAEFKPSHEPSFTLADFVKQGLEDRGHLNQINAELHEHLKQSPDVDLTRLEQPFIQNILKRLSIAPKPKQWMLDKDLSKEMRNQLYTQYLIAESRFALFLELTNKFWRLFQATTQASTSNVLRLKSRAYHAMLHENGRIEREIRKQFEKELDDVKAMMDMVSDLYKEELNTNQILKEDYAQFIEQTAQQFAIDVDTNPILEPVFKDTSKDQKVEFSKQYVDKYAKAEIKIEVLEEHLNKALNDLDKQDEQNPNTLKVSELKQKIKAKREKLDNLPQIIAKDCGFNDNACQKMCLLPIRQEIYRYHANPIAQAKAYLRETARSDQRLDSYQRQYGKLQYQLQVILRPRPEPDTAQVPFKRSLLNSVG